MKYTSKLLIVAALLGAFLFAGATQLSANTLLVDRGLPTTGVYAPSWAVRNNIGTGDYDVKDPIWSANPGWGLPAVPADDFTLPTAASSYHITGLRVWLCPNGAPSYGAAFNNVSLMLGQGTGTAAVLSKLSVTPTETDVTFPNTSFPLWQLDYALDLTAPGGAGYTFGVYGDGKACNNASGDGESDYIAFVDCTMEGYSSGYPHDGSDGYVKDFFANSGTFCDSYTFPEVWGIRAGDVSVQVFGEPVSAPEVSSTLALLSAVLFGLAISRKRFEVA
jgi:hypothetical protein